MVEGLSQEDENKASQLRQAHIKGEVHYEQSGEFWKNHAEQVDMLNSVYDTIVGFREKMPEGVQKNLADALREIETATEFVKQARVEEADLSLMAKRNSEGALRESGEHFKAHEEEYIETAKQEMEEAGKPFEENNPPVNPEDQPK